MGHKRRETMKKGRNTARQKSAVRRPEETENRRAHRHRHRHRRRQEAMVKTEGNANRDRRQCRWPANSLHAVQHCVFASHTGDTEEREREEAHLWYRYSTRYMVKNPMN